MTGHRTCFFRENDALLLDVFAGAEIDETMREAAAIARGTGRRVAFEFNGVLIQTRPDLPLDEALREMRRTWNKSMHRREGR